MESQDKSLIRAMWKRSRQSGAADSKATSGARYSLFLSFDEGLQVLVDAIQERLKEVAVRLDTKVESLAFDQATKRWHLDVGAAETIEAEAVCLALPSYVTAKLLRTTDDVLAGELEAIPYASTATINLAYRRSDIKHALNGFGFVVPYIERRSLLACTFSSVKFAGRAPEGFVLLRAFVGGALQPEMFALEDGAMIEAACRDLEQLLGIKGAPLFAEIRRWPLSMAQYHLGHIERTTKINERLAAFPSLKLAGNAFNGAGIPDCIRSGETAADELFQLISGQTACDA
jgi:oxygen-dependent protoporphyrinogen oxidase